MLLRKNFKTLIFIIIFLWGALSIIRTFYNTAVNLIETKESLSLTTEEKRHNLIECYPLISYMKGILHSDSIVDYKSENGACFFALRFYSYPSKIYWKSENERPFDFIITESKRDNKNFVKKIATKNTTYFVFKNGSHNHSN